MESNLCPRRARLWAHKWLRKCTEKSANGQDGEWEVGREEGLREKLPCSHCPAKAMGTDGLSTDKVLSSLVI